MASDRYLLEPIHGAQVMRFDLAFKRQCQLERDAVSGCNQLPF